MWPSPLWTRPPLFWPASCQRWNQTEQETSLPHHMITSPDSPTGSNSACCRRHKTNLAVSSGAAAPAINHLTSCDCRPPITEKLWNALECDKTRANQLSVIGWKLYHLGSAAIVSFACKLHSSTLYWQSEGSIGFHTSGNQTKHFPNGSHQMVEDKNIQNIRVYFPSGTDAGFTFQVLHGWTKGLLLLLLPVIKILIVLIVNLNPSQANKETFSSNWFEIYNHLLNIFTRIKLRQ